MLAGFLDARRATLELRCAELGHVALSRRAVGPSMLSLLNLVRHPADGERRWFRCAPAGQEAPPRFSSPACPDREDGWSGTVSLRRVLIHMVEECAGHNGHADLLRERIDGVRGL